MTVPVGHFHIGLDWFILKSNPAGEAPTKCNRLRAICGDLLTLIDALSVLTAPWVSCQNICPVAVKPITVCQQGHNVCFML